MTAKNLLPRLLLVGMSVAATAPAAIVPDPAAEAAEQVKRLRSDLLQERKDAQMRLFALGKEGPEMILPLLLAAADDPDPEVVQALTELTREIRWMLHMKEALALSGHDPDFRAAVERLYDRMGIRHGLSGTHPPAACRGGTDDLRPFLDIAIKGWMHPEACVTILSPFMDHPDSQVRSHALVAFARLRHQACGPIVVRALRDPNHVVRKMAFDAAVQCRLPETTPAILEMMLVKDNPVPLPLILKALLAFGDGRLSGRLTEIARTHVRAFAVAPATFGGEVTEEAFPDNMAAKALGMVGDPATAGAFLQGILDDPDAPPFKRLAACAGLETLAERARIPDLLKALDSPDRATRMPALKLLARLRERSASPRILERMGRWDADEQTLAITVLKDLGEPLHAFALLPYLARGPGHDEGVAASVQDAIEYLRSPRIVARLAALLDDPASAFGAACTLESMAGETWAGDADAKVVQARTWWGRRRQ